MRNDGSEPNFLVGLQQVFGYRANFIQCLLSNLLRPDEKQMNHTLLISWPVDMEHDRLECVYEADFGREENARGKEYKGLMGS